MQEQDITDYKIWEGIIHDMPFTGICRAHKQIVQSAKESNLPSVCICEDDICFADKGAFNYFINNTPEVFDLYLGSVYWGTILEDHTVKEFSALTLYIIHESFYNKFLSTTEINHIDRQMKMHEGIYKVCNPFVAKQFDGFSDNTGRVTDYNNKYFDGRKFYASKAENNDLITTSLNT